MHRPSRPLAPPRNNPSPYTSKDHKHIYGSEGINSIIHESHARKVVTCIQLRYLQKNDLSKCYEWNPMNPLNALSLKQVMLIFR